MVIITSHKLVQPCTQSQHSLADLQLHNRERTSCVSAGGQVCTVESLRVDVIAGQGVAVASPAERTFQRYGRVATSNPLCSGD